uniref:Immunoglobulin domain-containing protein n=1 Tax=Calidris pygmaea TaxID=425635 RepID=A0A8C3KQK7_9CHAR
PTVVQWGLWLGHCYALARLCTLYGSRFLMGEVGGSITHQCFYSITPANKHDRKYWCKIARSGICYTVISTTGYTSNHHAGRVSLKDVPQNGTFAVTLTELKKNDTGIYRCGIGTSNRDLYVSLNLTVSEGRMLAGERGVPTLPAAPLVESGPGTDAGASVQSRRCSLEGQLYLKTHNFLEKLLFFFFFKYVSPKKQMKEMEIQG